MGERFRVLHKKVWIDLYKKTERLLRFNVKVLYQIIFLRRDARTVSAAAAVHSVITAYTAESPV